MRNQSALKKRTNLSLNQDLLAEARRFGGNLSKAVEVGLRLAVDEAKTEAWKGENAAALESSNAWIKEYGSSLEMQRLF